MSATTSVTFPPDGTTSAGTGHSIDVGLDVDDAQVGRARVGTDRVTFAW